MAYPSDSYSSLSIIVCKIDYCKLLRDPTSSFLLTATVMRQFDLLLRAAGIVVQILRIDLDWRIFHLLNN